MLEKGDSFKMTFFERPGLEPWNLWNLWNLFTTEVKLMIRKERISPRPDGTCGTSGTSGTSGT